MYMFSYRTNKVLRVIAYLSHSLCETVSLNNYSVMDLTLVAQTFNYVALAVLNPKYIVVASSNNH